MISIVRLDERLIHGQIGVAWASKMGTDTLVVVNDKAANNPISKKTLLAAAPRNNKTVVKTMQEALPILNDPRVETKNIFVIVGNWEDLYQIITEVNGIHYVNIGNYGRLTLENPGYKRNTFGTDLFLDETEYPKALKVAEKAVEKEIRCEVQTVPENKAVSLLDVLKKE